MKTKLHHTKVGEGPNLVILHGLYGSSSNWKQIATKLSDEYTVYCLDARNHGESAWTDSMSYDQMADDIAYFIEDHDLTSVNLIGHSMGGKTAMAFAHRYSDKLKNLVIADMTPRAYPENQSHSRFINAMMNLDLSQINGRKEAELVLTSKLKEPKPVIQFLLQNLVYKNNKFTWRINLAALNSSLESIMGEISFNKPVKAGLFLYGEKADYVQQHDHPLIESQFPGSSIVGIENAGHWLHAEQPEQFTMHVRTYFSGGSGKI